MLEFLVIGYILYFLCSVYVSLNQISYVPKFLDKKPIFLSKENYKKAGNYSIEKEKVSLISHIYSFLIFCFWILFGIRFLQNHLQIEQTWLKTLVLLDLFIIVSWILSLPLSLYSSFGLDKKFGFSKVTIKLFIKDTLKTAILFFVLGNIVIYGLFLIITYLPIWWIYSFIFVFAIIILTNMLYPLIREKMFDKFVPLEDKALDEKITNLLTSVGFKSKGVFSVDASKRDSRLNAYFGGLGKTKRVVLFDTLIEKLSTNELLAVLGHELGHFKNKDILKNIGVMAVMLFCFFAIFGNLPQSLFSSLNLENSPASLVILFLIFTPFLSFFLMPIISLISRKNEYNADKFGANLTSKEDLKSALLKLINENKSFPFSCKAFVFFYYSHPPLIARLERLGYKEK